MSLPENVQSLLAARAATDPNAARLLKMFTRADEILRERPLKRVGDVEIPGLARVPLGLLS
jgi:hypothetical protein